MLIQSFFFIVHTPIAENIPYVIINTPDNMIIFDNGDTSEIPCNETNTLTNFINDMAQSHYITYDIRLNAETLLSVSQ